MTWFALRVQRLQFLVAVAAVVLFACWLVLTGTHDQAAWTALVHGGCLRNTGPPSTLQCNLLWIRFGGTDQWTLANLLILYAIPGLVGVVFGAPLVALEIERGTNRFVWTQSITRTHWLAVKLLVGGLFTAAIMGALVPLAEWWTGAAQTGAQISPKTFDVVGFAPIGYGLFAFLLGAALGALIRRSGWAIAVGIPLFAGTRILVRHYRSHFAPTTSWASNTTGASPGPVWPVNNGFEYQPANHFWALQGVETAIFVTASLLLLGLTVLAVRRWRT